MEFFDKLKKMMKDNKRKDTVAKKKEQNTTAKAKGEEKQGEETAKVVSLPAPPAIVEDSTDKAAFKQAIPKVKKQKKAVEKKAKTAAKTSRKKSINPKVATAKKVVRKTRDLLKKKASGANFLQKHRLYHDHVQAQVTAGVGVGTAHERAAKTLSNL